MGFMSAFPNFVEDALARNSSIRAFDTEDNNSGDGAIQRVGRGLQRNQGVRAVTLQEKELGVVGARELARALERGRILRLILGVDKASTEAVRVLADALKHPSRPLLVLCMWFGDTDLRREACGIFGEVLRRYPRRDFVLLRPDLNCAAKELDLPARAPEWSNGQILKYFRRQHLQHALVFRLGRLRADSLVSRLPACAIDSILAQYLGV